ncbi:nucleophile aminohydrolase [Pisolithus thermaeus]|nr:nucleophile aminohydrolase [Pisolithus thermaeus]
MSSSTVYVAVHAGAGHHDKASERSVKEVMKRACTEALRVSSIPGTDILSVVERAIVELEDDENINAGTGSNLTLDGTVECDAAIMDGRTGEFGSGGAVPGVKNPIKLAKAILCHSRLFDGLGRIPPLMLVSSGARSFAMRSGLEVVDPETMVSKRAKEGWQKWMERYNDVREEMIPESTALLDAVIQDTVGAVAWDDRGNVAAGVSSGGLLLKNSGRVGEAAIFGAGCWAQQPSNGKTGVACSISGTGEHIIRVGLARAIGDTFHLSENQEGIDVHDLLLNLLTERFYRPAVGYSIPRPNAGVLLLTAESGNSKPRLWCAFTAEGMAIAYASSEKPIPKATILRRPHITSRPDVPGKQSVYITALSM